MSDASPRCLVADDHPALLAAVADYLAGNSFDVVATAADGNLALAAARDLRPDVLLLDYRMPGPPGPELLRAAAEAAPGAALAVYTGDADERLVVEALAAGANGILLKEAPLADLVRALGVILAGGSYVDPALGAFAFGGGRSGIVLTEREVSVLALLAEGCTYDEIGARLSISGETVRTHLQKACDRLDASTRTQAVATAIRQGII